MRPYAISSVLLVCWGNFCRSPMAEAALRAEMRRTGTMAPVLSVGVSLLLDTINDQIGHGIAPITAPKKNFNHAWRNAAPLRGKLREFLHITCCDILNFRFVLCVLIANKICYNRLRIANQPPKARHANGRLFGATYIHR